MVGYIDDFVLEVIFEVDIFYEDFLFLLDFNILVDLVVFFVVFFFISNKGLGYGESLFLNLLFCEFGIVI